MKNKIQTIYSRVFGFARNHKKTTILAIIIVAIASLLIFKGEPKPELVTELATVRDLKRTVLATGQVTSITDLKLSFYSSDFVRSIRASVGDIVTKGQVLATLDNKDELANLISARGTLLSAQAKYQKVLDGASNEEIRLAEVTLENAKRDLENTKLQQSQLVQNALRLMLNSSIVAKALPGTSVSDTAPTISGTYNGTVSGNYKISTYSSGDGGYFTSTGLSSGFGSIISSYQSALGTEGLYITFPSGYNASSGATWIVEIPNTQSTTYVTNYNAYQASLNTQAISIAQAQALVDQRQAELDLKKAEARPADLESARAEVISAEGKVAQAESSYENTILRAPSNGTIVSIDIKLGELASPSVSAMTLQDVSNLYLEANINEANINSVSIGQQVEVTFDAFGPDKKYIANISQIDPSSTIVSGVVNYKVKATVNSSDEVKPGMTANMTIITDEKINVLVVPTRAVIQEDGQDIVRVVLDKKKGKFENRSVVTGLVGDDGTEILSGIFSGEEIVVLINKPK
jgi:RND family efflux transporter MFP subunit